MTSSHQTFRPPLRDTVVDPQFSKLVTDIQAVVGVVVLGLEEVKLDENEFMQEYERQVQEMSPGNVPELSTLTQEVRHSSAQFVTRINDALKRLQTSLANSIAVDVRKVARSVVDEYKKSLTDRVRVNMQLDDMSAKHCEYHAAHFIGVISSRLDNVSTRLHSLREKNHRICQLEQELGLQPGGDERVQQVQQLLKALDVDDYLIPHALSSKPASLPKPYQPVEPEENAAEVAAQPSRPASPASPIGKVPPKGETVQSATKDKTFAEILTDGDNVSKKWETKRLSNN